ncbi:lipopolysaccharide heptosyltransferase I [Spartinivicinus poritis]|uniref:Lipopolysaccharide heptosyltransferase 1 n=1 Tax=Spartinivicinus poritis TaxID=2994640 RepID=A0ABT5U913_9GAMM|nr:lipopolysaccharide heptosyltransferase I [Spartinivicinus sp. A2-2]MDE1461938.1 lipopolysaccharide heptosyltransferase I [Spartinivicinus sp. A2-2]
MKVLVIKTSSMGDVIHTLPALTDAQAQIPNIQFDWVVEEAFAEIPHWHKAVNKVIPVAIRRWRKQLWQTWKSGEWKQFKQQLKAEHYDCVIDAQGLLKSAWLAQLANGSKFGLDKQSAREPISARFYDSPVAVAKDQHAVERVRQLFAQALGYSAPSTMGHFSLDKTRFPKQQCTDQPYVVFIHGTTWPTKHYPVPYWQALADQVVQAGFQVLLPWGNAVEKQRAETIAASVTDKSTGSGIKVLPKMKLAELAGVIADATAVVAVDTGLGHLTSALEVPAVSLYGPTSPKLVGAYGANQVHLCASDLEQLTDRAEQTIEPAIFKGLTPDVVWQSLTQQLEVAQ